MTESARALASWVSFYVMVGSSGGALIGLQFVVLTLVADRRQRTSEGTLRAFGTPTVVHFAVALIISAIMSAPWPSLLALSCAIGVCGFGGLMYGAIVIRRARRQTEYEPVWEDWLWHTVLPYVCYLALLVAAALLRAFSQSMLFVIGASALGLLLIGIHNAWDTVTHIVVTAANERTSD